MSWSINAKGNKADVKARLNNPPELSHVQGKERDLADSAVNPAIAVVHASSEKFKFEVSLHGSAVFENGEQTGQAIGVNVALLFQ